MSHISEVKVVQVEIQAAPASPDRTKNNPSALNGRTVEIRVKCSVATQVKAVCFTVLTLGLILIAKSFRDALAGRKVIRIYSNDTKDQISAKIDTMKPNAVKAVLKIFLRKAWNKIFDQVPYDGEILKKIREEICSLIKDAEDDRLKAYTPEMVANMDLEELKVFIPYLVDSSYKFIDQSDVSGDKEHLVDELVDELVIT